MKRICHLLPGLRLVACAQPGASLWVGTQGLLVFAAGHWVPTRQLITEPSLLPSWGGMPEAVVVCAGVSCLHCIPSCLRAVLTEHCAGAVRLLQGEASKWRQFVWS